MKKLIFILMLLPTVCLAQSNGEGSMLNKEPNAIAQAECKNEKAGLYLEQAGQTMQAAHILYVASAVLVGMSTITDQNTTTYIGGGLSLLAVGFQISASGKIKLAGKELRSDN